MTDCGQLQTLAPDFEDVGDASPFSLKPLDHLSPRPDLAHAPFAHGLVVLRGETAILPHRGPCRQKNRRYLAARLAGSLWRSPDTSHQRHRPQHTLSFASAWRLN